MKTKHYGTLAGHDDADQGTDLNTSYSSDEALNDAANPATEQSLIKVESSRVTATIGLLVSFLFVAMILLIAVTNGGNDFSGVNNVGKSMSSIMSTLTVPFTSSSVDESGGESTLQDPTNVDNVLVTLTATDQVQPNFVVIVADDLGWNSLSYNDEEISFATPVLSGLASKGIIMGNYYAQEVCSPSRAALLTGRYPLSTGMQYGMIAATAEWGLDLDEVTIAEVLSDNGYKTHMLGKWHLGYFSPLFLPTARGFDDYIGYLNGENYYWSKRSTDYPEFVDFLESDKDCYAPYNGSDKHDYSTTFYTNHAIQIIDDHAVEDPLFLYLAYQAVHDPFVDTGKFRNGMPDSILDADVLSQIHSSIIGTQRKEYIKSLYQLDTHIGYLYDKLVDKGMIDNTYIIFMSDNGGCFYGGGKNGPLRGSKGSLFEGGIKVDSFIYSPKLKSGGTTYNGLMHVSDWFPTMLALANIEYVPDADHPLDGVNQVDGWLNVRTPRETLLYNYYTALTDYNFNIWYNGSFAVRDERFKLMHTYDDSLYGAWYNPTDIVDTDEELTSDNRCAQQFLSGDFTVSGFLSQLLLFCFLIDSLPHTSTPHFSTGYLTCKRTLMKQRICMIQLLRCTHPPRINFTHCFQLLKLGPRQKSVFTGHRRPRSSGNLKETMFYPGPMPKIS